MEEPDNSSGVTLDSTKKETYNTGDSLVVTHPTTGPAVGSLSKGERTGSRAFYRLWSYVSAKGTNVTYMVLWKSCL